MKKLKVIFLISLILLEQTACTAYVGNNIKNLEER